MKKEGENTFQYKYLALDVQGNLNFADTLTILTPRSGHPIIYLEKQDAVKEASKKPGIKMFGVEWR